MAEDGEHTHGGDEQNNIIDQARAHDDQRQDQPWERHLLDEVAVVDEDPKGASNHFHEKAPTQHPRGQVNGVGEGALEPWQFGRQDG